MFKRFKVWRLRCAITWHREEAAAIRREMRNLMDQQIAVVRALQAKENELLALGEKP